MNRFVAALLLLAACGTAKDVNIAKPQIDLVQLYAPGDLQFARGPGEILAEFGFRIANRAAQPITLKRIELSSIGSGSYVLRRENRGFKQEIPPGGVAEVTMTARAYYNASSLGQISNEPVLLRAVVYFDSPEGSFRQILSRQIEQFSTGPH